MNPLTPPSSPPRYTGSLAAPIPFSRTCVHNKQPERLKCKSNLNGNAGRFYFKCSMCPNISGWDDTVGIFPENPLCNCEPRWRTRTARKNDGDWLWRSCANPGGNCGFGDPGPKWRDCTPEDIERLEKQKREVVAGSYNYYREEVKEEVESKEVVEVASEEEEESEEDIEFEGGEEESDMHGFENRTWYDYDGPYIGTEEYESDGERDLYEGSRHKLIRWQGRGLALGL